MIIRSDVLQMLDDYKAGKPVRSIELGHTHRMVESPGVSPRIDQETHYRQNQDRAHAYCFRILDHFAEREPESFEQFQAVCNELEIECEGLTPEERDGAESLAWKAMLIGWKKSIDGHRDAHYIEVQRQLPRQGLGLVRK